MLQIIEIDVDLLPVDKIEILAVTAENVYLKAEASWYDIRQADPVNTKDWGFERWYQYYYNDRSYMKDLFLNLPIGCLSIIPE